MSKFNSFVCTSIKNISLFKAYLKRYVRKEIPWPYITKLNKPIFIIGSSRSGTTMLADLLNSFPEICSFTEDILIRKNMRLMVESPELIPQKILDLEKILVRLSGINPDQRILEKSPGHSLLSKPLADYFSDAKFIHIVRNACDVSSSMLKHEWIADELREIHKVFWFKLLPVEFQQEWSKLGTWERGILRWAVYVDSARQIASYQNRYLEVRYEEICQSPRECVQNILTFLELNTFPGLERQLAEIKPKSVDRWQKENLTSEQSQFHQKVLSVFNITLH